MEKAHRHTDLWMEDTPRGARTGEHTSGSDPLETVSLTPQTRDERLKSTGLFPRRSGFNSRRAYTRLQGAHDSS